MLYFSVSFFTLIVVKHFFSLAIISILLTSQLRVSLLIANFYLNRERITQEHCINLAQGITSCQGKCHLDKQLEEEKSKDEKSPEIIIEERVSLFFQTLAYTNDLQLDVVKDIIVHYEPIYDFLYIDSTFHPPERLST